MALSETTIKWRIKALKLAVSRVNSAASQMGSLNTAVNDLKKLLSTNAKLNDEIPYSEHLDKVLNETGGIKQSLSGRIVNSLYYRIKEYKKQLE